MSGANATQSQMDEATNDGRFMRAKEPPYSKFTQQELPASRPLLTPKKVIVMFFTIGIIFVPIGAVCLAASRSVVEVEQRYDDTESCMPGTSNNVERKELLEQKLTETQGEGTTCAVELTIPAEMKPPVYVYYKLTNFYQNHRRYVKSRADSQLRGDSGPLSDDTMADCEPQLYSGDAIIKPCGLMAWSFFNDTYTFEKNGDTAMSVSSKGIAWPSDIKYKFSDTVEPENFGEDPDKRGGGAITGAMNSDEHFIVWMRTAALPTFRKLWGIYDKTLAEGDKVTINIANRYNTYRFDGSKTIILSTTSWMGGKNDFMGIAYLVIGCLCMFMGLACTLINIFKPRMLGDITLLSWHK